MVSRGVVDMGDGPKGYKQSDMWIVELEEDDWYGTNDCGKDAIRATARRNARYNQCWYVGVFVTPDPVFPMCGQERRHRVFHDDLRELSAKQGGFKVSITLIAELDTELYEKASAPERKRMVSNARDAVNAAANGNPGRYTIQVQASRGGYSVLETGRV